MAVKGESLGKCCICGGEFTKKDMAKHLQTCGKTEQQGKKNGANNLLIMAEGRYLPEYWLFIKVNAKATLKSLDTFLRNIWLECCGHMSEFEIGRIRYGVDSYGELGSKSMNTSLSNVLDVGTKFYHNYDFGSTTHLALKVISEQQSPNKGKSIKLLARNNPPEINCIVCGKPATEVCTECLWSDKGAVFCDKCADSHDCDEDMFLPVVNSPRVGVCGYTGD